MNFVAGVDTHKMTHTIVVLNSVGAVVLQRTISAEHSAYIEVIAEITALGEVSWGIEGTGSYGQALADVLFERGAIVFEVPGAVTQRYRQRGTRRGKSDPLDARAIAEAVLREPERLPRYERRDEQEAVRLLYDHRDRLVRERTEAINRLRAAALRLKIPQLPSDLTTGPSLQRVRQVADALVPRTHTETILLDELRETLTDIERFNKRIRELRRQLDPFVERLAANLLPMFGVSTIVAAGLVGHAGNLARCRDASAFAMRAGAAPVPYRSGSSQSVRLNPGGNRQLNRCLHTIATTQLRDATHSGRAYYDRKRSEGMSHLAALRSLKRQLATVVYHKLAPHFRELLSASAA